MLNWWHIILSLFSFPGINILIGIFSLYYGIRCLWFKAIFCFLLSTSLLYAGSIPLISDTLMLKLESRYKPFKLEDISKYSGFNAIFAVFSNSYLCSDLVIAQNLLQLSKGSKLPTFIINLNKERLYGNNADPINTYITSIIKSSGVTDLNVPVLIDNINFYIDQKERKDNKVSELEKNNIRKIFLISDSWNIPKVQRMLKKFKLEEIVIIPVMSNLQYPNNHQINSFIPNITSLLRSEMVVENYFYVLVAHVKALFGAKI